MSAILPNFLKRCGPLRAALAFVVMVGWSACSHNTLLQSQRLRSQKGDCPCRYYQKLADKEYERLQKSTTVKKSTPNSPLAARTKHSFFKKQVPKKTAPHNKRKKLGFWKRLFNGDISRCPDF